MSLRIRARKGFTLIELLIVVAIIGLLASVIIIGLQGAQRGGRDARRISDLQQIQNGLQLYYNAKSKYPDAATLSNVSTLNSEANISTMGVKLPEKGPSGDDYKYLQLNSGTGYLLQATLDDPANKKGGVSTKIVSGSGETAVTVADCTGTTTYCIQF